MWVFAHCVFLISIKRWMPDWADSGLAIWIVLGRTSRAPIPFLEHRRTILHAPAPFFEHQRTIPRAPIPFLEQRRTIKTVLPERSYLGLTIGGPSKQYFYVGFRTFRFSDLDKKMESGLGRFWACDFDRAWEDLPSSHTIS